jgi:enamine deaminase RidA (YjgF/YER057c/UK114 family)
MVQRFGGNQRMSEAVVHNGTVYLAGQVANDAKADIKTQTEEVLANIEEGLALAGSDKTKILSATIYLSDMRYFPEMNAVWDAWVSQGNQPARATVGAPLAAPGYKIEISVIAAA